MDTRESVLESLSDSAIAKTEPVDEIKLGSLVKAAAGLALGKKLFGGTKLPAISKHSRPVSAVGYAKDLVKAKTGQDSVAAVLGLLNIGGHVLLKIPELRDLGHRVIKVVNDSRFEDYFE